LAFTVLTRVPAPEGAEAAAAVADRRPLQGLPTRPGTSASPVAAAEGAAEAAEVGAEAAVPHMAPYCRSC